MYRLLIPRSIRILVMRFKHFLRKKGFLKNHF